MGLEMPLPTSSLTMTLGLGRGRDARMPLAAAVGAVVSVGFYVWTTITEPTGLAFAEEVVGFAFLVGIGMVPFVVAGAFRFGLIAFLGALAVAAGLNILGYVLAQDDSSSTSGVAAFVMPFYSTVAVLLVAGLDGVVRALRRRRGRSDRRRSADG